VVTQRPDLARSLVASLRERGAQVLEVPATHWRPPAEGVRLNQAVAELKSYDWILSATLFASICSSRVFPDLQRPARTRQRAVVRIRADDGAEVARVALAPAAAAADHKTPLIMEPSRSAAKCAGKDFWCFA